MATFYLSHPSLHGQGAPVIIFSTDRSRDGDVWPEIWFDPTGNPQDVKRCSGRIRMSGSGSDKMKEAMVELSRVMARDERRTQLGHQDDMWGSIPHKPKSYVERHVDDGYGFFGLEICKGGDVRIRMRPHPKTEEGIRYSGDKDVEIRIPASTSYLEMYMFFPQLWKAIRKDNAKLGNFHGFHA